MLEGEEASVSCPNCGHAAGGSFCSRCGQELIAGPPTASAVLRDYAAEVFSVDGTVPRTLRALVEEPGGLTKAWIEGRWRSYVSPGRLYALLAAIFFLVWPFISPEGGVLNDLARVSGESVRDGGAPLGASFADSVDNAFRVAMVIVMVPVLGLLAHVVAARQTDVMPVSFVMALHTHAFVFLTVICSAPIVLAQAVPGLGAAVYGFMVPMAFLLYLCYSVRAVFGHSWSSAVARVVVIGCGYAAVLVVLMLGVGRWAA